MNNAFIYLLHCPTKFLLQLLIPVALTILSNKVARRFLCDSEIPLNIIKIN